MNIIRFSRRRLFSFILLLGILASSASEGFSQAAQNWSPQQRIPGLTNEALTPYLLADTNKTVHAFVSDWIGDNEPQLVIMYLNWTMNRGWSKPVDIILPQSGLARIKGVLLDDEGIIHLAYFDGDDISASIYYSQAYASNAGQARAWSIPIEVGPLAITPADAVLAGNNEHQLVITYLGRLNERGIYSIYSQDGGDTWSEPTPVYSVSSEEQWPSAFDVFMDSKNKMHLAWTVRAPNSTENELVYYARLDMENFQWSQPQLLAELEEGHLAWSISIVEYQNEVFAIYHDDNPTTRWMRRSRDGGDSWSEPVRLFDHIGSNGAASLVVDGNGELHMFFGNRTGWPSIHGIWTSKWDGYRWTIPIPVVSGFRVVDKFGQYGFDPSFARAVVSQGNLILVTWTTDPGAGLNGNWYSYLLVNAPEEPVFPLPVPPEQSITPTLTITMAPTPEQKSPLPEELLFQDQTGISTDSITNPRNTIVWITGIIPVLLLISATVFYHRRKKVN